MLPQKTRYWNLVVKQRLIIYFLFMVAWVILRMLVLLLLAWSNYHKHDCFSSGFPSYDNDHSHGSCSKLTELY